MFRKSVAKIIAPLNKIYEELSEAIKYHEEQQEQHRYMQLHHEQEKHEANVVRLGVGKLLGKNTSD